MKQAILQYINNHTDRNKMDTVSTIIIARVFNLQTNTAYIILKSLADEKKIMHLEAVNGDNFHCADWCRISDAE